MDVPSSKKGAQADRGVVDPCTVYTFQLPVAVPPSVRQKLVSETPIFLRLTLRTSAKERMHPSYQLVALCGSKFSKIFEKKKVALWEGVPKDFKLTIAWLVIKRTYSIQIV